jgi:hypothetical protein
MHSHYVFSSLCGRITTEGFLLMILICLILGHVLLRVSLPSNTQSSIISRFRIDSTCLVVGCTSTNNVFDGEEASSDSRTKSSSSHGYSVSNSWASAAGGCDAVFALVLHPDILKLEHCCHLPKCMRRPLGDLKHLRQSG